MLLINAPVPFPGTELEAAQNMATHGWLFDDDGQRCVHCDAKTWHRAAEYPCGAEPARMVSTFHDGEFYVLKEGERIPTDWPADVREEFATHILNWGF